MVAANPVELTAARRSEMALVLPELGTPVALAGEAQRLLLHRAVEATLAEAARAGLGAVIVDDLQLGDDASVTFLQTLIQSEALAPLRWGFAQRSAGAGAAATALRSALEEAQLLDVVGGSVRGGDVYGKFPNLAINGPDTVESQGQLLPTTSVDEYAATMARWFGVAETDIPLVIPNIGRFATPNMGFMAAVRGAPPMRDTCGDTGCAPPVT